MVKIQLSDLMQQEQTQPPAVPDSLVTSIGNRISVGVKRIITPISVAGLLIGIVSLTFTAFNRLPDKDKAPTIELIKTLLTPLTPLASIGAVLLTIKNSNKNAQETLKIAQQGQDSDRFNRATDLLSSGEAYKQISGINTLRVLAHIDPLNALFIEQIFASFIREKAAKSAKSKITEADKQKALSDHVFLASLCAKTAGSPVSWALTGILPIREQSYRGQPVDKVPALPLGDLDLSFSAFRWRYLCNVIFTNCDLRGAFFLDSTVVSCYFGESDLTGARFWNTKLCETTFASSNITNVDLSGATGLTWEHLWAAKSSGGTLLPDYLLNSPDIPKDFDRDYYDKHGWTDPVYHGRKKLEEMLQPPLPPLPPLPEA